ncbi:Ig-like domain repeat protein [Cellulomonas sp. PSBB021]|uniref:Ig-like domain repeat protein n=1 Tax=Cellulomonas sp. PSBB021 TaxID=2003551 RepID=UPI000B8D4A9C|nr:Ig-like domain repeat protein [Cellulomonas sp. PSBB021]ASR56432.1 hypothetical protein CBP52_16500 [Cellulomonas sp. PSBB021]
MLKKKTLALTLAAALAVPAALAIPAVAAGNDTTPAAPAATTSESVLTTVAAPYPATVRTTTSASAAPVVYGTGSTVSVTVKAATGTPTGYVKVKVGTKTFTKGLTSGKATLSLGKLNKGTYSASVTYTPTSGSEFKGSSTAVAVKVTAGKTTVKIANTSIAKGKAPAVYVKASRDGKATVTITGPNGFKVTKIIAVKGGKLAKAAFTSKVRASGTYKVSVKFTPTSTNYSGSTAAASVRVR